MVFITKQFAAAAAAEGDERLRILADIGAQVDATDKDHSEELWTLFSDAVEFGRKTLRLRQTAFTQSLGVKRATVWRWQHDGRIARTFVQQKQVIKWVLAQGNPALMSYLTLDFEKASRAAGASRLEIFSQMERDLEQLNISDRKKIRDLFRDAMQFGRSALSLSKEDFAAGLYLKPITIYKWQNMDKAPRNLLSQKTVIQWVIKQARLKAG